MVRKLYSSPVILTLTVIFAACSGDPGVRGKSTLVETKQESPGGNCSDGGFKIEIGIDDDEDAQLDESEIDFTAFICDGANGTSANATPEQPGPNCTYGGVKIESPDIAPHYICHGATGETGAEGQSVIVTPEEPGGNCAYGGEKLQVGNGLPTYVCNGASGADGLSVSMISEPPGENCAYGGVKLQVGAGVISYICNGTLPGTTLPMVVTKSVTDIHYYDALAASEVTDDGSELIIVRGVCLATHTLPDLHDTIYFSGFGSGSFDTLCDALLPDTMYYVRAFATNSLGTSYGNEISFNTKALTIPILTTQTVSNITSSTAISGGDITDDGGTSILERGLCWSESPDPTTENECVSEGLGSGSYIALAAGLTTDTTYHIRAYATNAQGTGYGEDLSFTTEVLPVATVTTNAVSSISYTTATSGGNVTGDHGSPVSSRGICWSINPEPTMSDDCYIELGGLGVFSAHLSGLTANTTYFVRAFAENGGGISYGNQLSFKTLPTSLPVMTTRAISGISSYLAGSGGDISTDGGSTITTKGVCWSMNPNPTIANNKTNDGAGSSGYNSTITGLEKLTTYYVRAYATNTLGTAYGNQLSFKTTDTINPGPTIPVVGTSASTIASSTTASSGGYVSNDGGSEVTARGVCWNTTGNPTLDNTCSSDGSGVGFFTSNVTGLSGCGEIYYIRAYATNSTGTAYGIQNTVSTGLLPAVSTAVVTDIGYYAAVSGGSIFDDGGCPIIGKGVCWSWNPNPTLGNPHTSDGAGSDSFISNITGLMGYQTYYVRAYATNSVGTTYGEQEIFVTAEPPTPYIGQNYAGGIVFYIDGTGEHGLVVAPTDQGFYNWGCDGTSISTGTALGDGPTNTAAIVAVCGESNFAAKIANDLVLNGYDDWFMPSLDELSLIRNQLYLKGLGGFAEGEYSSSSQGSASENWMIYFPHGFSWKYPKLIGLRLRSVRAF